jgi:hypothetical protein
MADGIRTLYTCRQNYADALESKGRGGGLGRHRSRVQVCRRRANAKGSSPDMERERFYWICFQLSSGLEFIGTQLCSAFVGFRELCNRWFVSSASLPCAPKADGMLQNCPNMLGAWNHIYFYSSFLQHMKVADKSGLL